MNLKRKLERIWEDLPCLSPSHFIKWNLFQWIDEGTNLILRWIPGKLGGKRSSYWPKKHWRRRWRKLP